MTPESILSVIKINAAGLADAQSVDEAKVYLDTLSHLSYLLGKATEKSVVEKEKKAEEDEWL